MVDIKTLKDIIEEKVVGQVVPAHTETAHFYKYLKTGKTYKSVTAMSGILDNPHLKIWAAKMAVEYVRENFDSITKDNLDGILKAAKFAHRDMFKDAGGIGTVGHDVVDRYMIQWLKTGTQPDNINDFVIGTDSRANAIGRSAEKFFNDFDVVPVATELKVASARYEYAGTLDAIGLVKQVLRKVDNPCSNKYHEWCTKNKRQWEFTCFKCNERMKYVLSLIDWKSSNSIDKKDYAMQVSAYWQAFYEMTGIRLPQSIIVRLDKNKARYEILKIAHRPSALKAFLACGKVAGWIDNGADKLVPLQPKIVTLEEMMK